MTNILKSWKTTLVGLIILCGLAYKAFTVGFSVQDAVFGLLAAGFILTKDSDKSHSVVGTVDPDNPTKPPTKG